MRVAVQREEQTPQFSRTVWPDSVAYREAIQTPSLNISDSELRQAAVSQNKQGLPIAYTGRFAVVFRMVTPSKEQWAFRCFTLPPEAGQSIHGERGARYQLIANHLKKFDHLFVPYRYIERGIKIGTTWYPTVAMQWANGETLGKFVERNLKNPTALRDLAGALSDALLKLEENKIAHGDWQHDNILVADAGKTVTLVDYDGMYVPELEGFSAPELGHANYQHPLRTTEDYGVGLDRFSCLVIQTALLALAHDPNLWSRFSDGDSLLFRQSDLRDPSRSPLFHTLRALVQTSGDELLADTLVRLEDGCRTAPLSTLPPAVPAVAPPAKSLRQNSEWQEVSTAAEAKPETAASSAKWWLNGTAPPKPPPASAKTATQQTKPTKQRTAAKTTATAQAVAPDAYKFLEKLTAAEARGTESRHIWRARAVALFLGIAATAVTPLLSHAGGMWFFIWFGILQLVNGGNRLYQEWPRRLILAELDAEVAKMNHAIREREQRIHTGMSQSSSTPQEKFIVEHLERTPIYRVLSMPGITVDVLNRLHNEGIETALHLRGRNNIYGVMTHEMASLILWCRNLETEAVALYRQQAMTQTNSQMTPQEQSRLAQEIAEFERERAKLIRERERFPDTTPGAFINRIFGRT